jgi:hypothetical protein
MASANAYPSPNGHFLLELHGIEMRMSHTVENPYLIASDSGKCLFSPGSLWDAFNIEWSDDSKRLTMTMRHYDNGTHYFSLALDLENDAAVLALAERELLTGSLESVSNAMSKIHNVRLFLKGY